MGAGRQCGGGMVSRLSALRRLDAARLSARLRWSAYRSVDLFGVPGLVAAVLLLGMLAAELAIVLPTLAHQRAALARIASQRSAHSGAAAGIRAGRADMGKATLQRDADVPHILALIGKHGLSTHEVKYRQIAGGGFNANAKTKSGAGAAPKRSARIAMALPTSGSYSEFHELMAGLSAFRGVQTESFTLRRNLPTERTLAIDLNLSIPLPAIDSATKAPPQANAHRNPQAYRDLFPEQDRQREIAAALPPPVAAPPPAPSAPPLPFRLAGVWADGTQRKFILSRGDRPGQSVIACRGCRGTLGNIGIGDRFFDDYRLEKIGTAQLTFTYLPLSLRQTIDIDGAMRATGN
jgi:hypothetical protein